MRYRYMMNCNEKGVRGLIKVIDDLQEKGFYSFPAFDDHSPIDIIAVDRLGNSYRLQVKYKGEGYGLSAVTVVNGKKLPINRNMIDGWAVYLAKHKKVVYLNVRLLEGKKSCTIDPSKDYGELDNWKRTSAG